MSENCEYNCVRCGIRVVWCSPPPPESIYCLTCRFIEGIEDDQDREQSALWLDAKDIPDQEDPRDRGTALL